MSGSHPLTRRQWLGVALAGSGLAGAAVAAQPDAPTLAPRTLVFPRDHGSHPELRTEWWYLTGQAHAGGRPWGFQITFFRSRVDATQSLRSAFAAHQLLFAHAALTDVQGQRLLHDQRIARAGFGLAEAALQDTRVHLHDWSLVRETTAQPGASRYQITAQAADFGLQLTCASTQPVLLQGEAGLSRKGPSPSQASYYYSQPQLAVTGHITANGRRMALVPGARNRAWLDHEWSEALMHPDAVGWDWIGMNLDDGSALTAFQLRRADASALWAGGSWRRAGLRQPEVFAHDAVRFTSLAWARAAISGERYPVRWRVQTPAGSFEVQALVPDQEVDSRASTGALYWEGLSELRNAAGRVVGNGYLEMTGYARRLQLG